MPRLEPRVEGTSYVKGKTGKTPTGQEYTTTVRTGKSGTSQTTIIGQGRNQQIKHTINGKSVKSKKSGGKRTITPVRRLK